MGDEVYSTNQRLYWTLRCLRKKYIINEDTGILNLRSFRQNIMTFCAMMFV
ncbi:hypothetical protein HMPREF1548_04849 [Clostridium sp. KLE 1755]|nr:hypothetical protein HMPREF1548_04849 [Clostridium sp. KLE 1755]